MIEEIDISRIRALSPLKELQDSNFETLLEGIEILKAQSGQTLFEKGDTANSALYVLSGVVQLRNGEEVVQSIEGGSDEARFPIAPSSPRQQAAVAHNDIEYVIIDSELLDVTVTWDQTGIYEVDDARSHGRDETGDWMSALLQVRAFQKIPAANIQAIFMRLNKVNYKAGDVVVQQGDEGDFFYVISQGHCKVTRVTHLKDAGIVLGELKSGDTFGEEALISEAQRNATVTMQTDGELMRLGKDDFRMLLNEPALDWLDLAEAQEMVADGAQWLDVRMPGEFNASHFDDALNLPLYTLRPKLSLLDHDKQYVVCCDTGRRSSAAAYILQELDFQTFVLRGGLNMSESEAVAS